MSNPEKEILEMQKNQMITAASAINSFDWKEVGKRYIISGSKSGHVYIYINAEKKHEPLFGKPLAINVDIREDSDPYIVDWNNDGKKDFVIGAKNGEVLVFINKGTNQFLQLGKEIKLNNGDLDVGFSSSPAMVDWNGDGKKDLVVGNGSGSIFVFFNIGEDHDPAFSSKGIKTDIKVPSSATPFVVDWNNDGKFDVVCGSWDGKVYIFINEGTDKNPVFGKPQTIHVNNKELRLLGPTSVIAVDWDKDGKTDLLVSNKEAVEEGPTPDRKNIIPLGIYFLINTGTKEKPEFKELKPIKGNFKDDTVL
jgi:WD40 repeat protein